MSFFTKKIDTNETWGSKISEEKFKYLTVNSDGSLSFYIEDLVSPEGMIFNTPNFPNEIVFKVKNIRVVFYTFMTDLKKNSAGNMFYSPETESSNINIEESIILHIDIGRETFQHLLITTQSQRVTFYTVHVNTAPMKNVIEKTKLSDCIDIKNCYISIKQSPQNLITDKKIVTL